MASSVASRAIARQLQQLIQHNDVPDERIAQIMHEAVATSVEPIAAQLELVLLESAKIDALREAEREAEREADSARCGFDAVSASQRAGGDDGVACERLSGDDTGLREGGVRERLSTRLPGTGVDPDEERRVLCEREGLEDDAVDHILALQQELPSARMRDAQRAHEARQNRAAGGEDEGDEVDGAEVTDALLPEMTGEGAVPCSHPAAQPACLEPAPQLDVDSSSGGDPGDAEADGASGYHALVSDSDG